MGRRLRGPRSRSRRSDRLADQRGAVVDVYAAARMGDVDRLRRAARRRSRRWRGCVAATARRRCTSPRASRSRAMLVEAGADVDALDVDHESTPAQYLVRDRPDVARYLVDRGCRTDILLCAALGDLDRVRRHLDADLASAGMTVSATLVSDARPARRRIASTIGRWPRTRRRTRSRASSVTRRWSQLLFERSPAAIALAAACEIGEEVSANAIVAAASRTSRASLDGRTGAASAGRRRNGSHGRRPR